MNTFLPRIVFVVLIFASLAGRAQDDCEVILNRAAEELSAGHFLGIDSLLAPCFENGFSREQRQRANLLMTQVYLLLDNPEKAEESYLELLRANPEFQTDPARDPIDVVYLSKKFTATPIFSIFGKIGGNVSFVNVIGSENITGEPTTSSYSLKPGYNAAIGADWNITEKVSLSTELQFSSISFEREQLALWSVSSSQWQERILQFSVPLSIKYHFSAGRFVPYAYAGAAAGFLISSRTSAVLVDREFRDSDTVTPSESPAMDNSFRRNKTIRSGILGGGMLYKSGLHYWFVDLRYAFGLNNLYNGAIYDNSQSVVVGGYRDNTSEAYQGSGDSPSVYAAQDDFFRVSNLFLTIGYKHQLYKPRKLKKARTGSVLRFIRKSENEQPK